MYTLKKSLGQHFLHDENICRRIVDVLDKKPFTQLLEVGPGGGAITKYLLQIPGVDFKAIEVDHDKVIYLLDKYPAISGKLVEADFLKSEPPFEGAFTIIGNFPYNISTEILFRVLEWRGQVETVIGMFQKEVAQRVASAPGSKVYGVTSVLIQAFFEVEYLFEISEGAFNPPPKVKSAVIRLTPLENPPEIRSVKHFFMLVKAAFNQRRKMLRNSVKPYFNAASLEDEIFNRRPEQMSVADFAALTFRMA